jgi:hypothetical protein
MEASQKPSQKLQKVRARAGKKGGKVISEAKARASAANGKLGGRPKKPSPNE